MSRSLFFQLDREAFCTLAEVGPHNVMFYDMIRGQYDRLLCSVQKQNKKQKKRAKKQTKEKEQLKFNYEKYKQKLAVGTSRSNDTLPLISPV